MSKKNHSDLLREMTFDDKVALLSGNGLWRTTPIPELDIRSVIMTDGTYGVRYSVSQIDGYQNWGITDFLSVIRQDAAVVTESLHAADNDSPGLFSHSRPATCFPNGSSLACSWDVALIREMGRALARECQHMGVGILLGPGINIRRSPLAGRGYEYYSEDPVLSGDLAAALINGLQESGVGASLKHFACNNSEYQRTQMDSIVDERALREIYLYGFQRAIKKSQPWTVMSSYNRLNGEQTSQHYWLLTKVLREEWGYTGVVVSDWYGIKNRPASLLAGNDLEMPENAINKAELLRNVQDGLIPVQVLDNACLRMLQLIDKVIAGRQQQVDADFAAHHKLAQRIAAESLVLLKNESGLLPLDSTILHRVAVIGKPAQHPVIQGSGCATTQPWLLDCPLDEIVDIAGAHIHIEYAVGAPDDYENDDGALDRACDVAAKAEVAIVFVSTPVGMDGENGDRKDLALLPSHELLIKRLADVQKRLVVILCNGDAVVMPWLPDVPAVIECFFAGQGMGRAVAETLFGLNNPCGKLTTTLPNSVEETPAYLHYPGENGRHLYSEGIFVGYRYYDKKKLDPLFPFGFGLSYTKFEYRNLQLSTVDLGEDDTLTISLEIHNCGKIDGKEIAQLYVAPPKSRLARAEQALRAFAKVSVPPGEFRTVEFTLTRDDFAYYDPGMADWVVDSGAYELRVGKSSRDTPLIGTVEFKAKVRYPRLSLDSSLVQLSEHPPMYRAVAELIADKCNQSSTEVLKKLESLAPHMPGGMWNTIVNIFQLDVSRSELQALIEACNKA